MFKAFETTLTMLIISISLNKLSSHNTRMASALFLHEFKRQASFFFKEKIKTARLALTDVTPAQLLTEDATRGDSPVPDARTMRLISRAAFEVEDYWRIVDILHKRLSKFDKQYWRAFYNALCILEHLLTHGPLSIAEEFQADQDRIRDMGRFHYIDEKGFNWGLSMRKRSERIIELIENKSFRKEERARCRKLVTGIKGFGSFCKRPASADGSMKDAIISSEKYNRCNSLFYDNNDTKSKTFASEERFTSHEERHGKADKIDDVCFTLALLEKTSDDGDEDDGYAIEDDHPFYDNGDQTRASLLSSVK